MRRQFQAQFSTFSFGFLCKSDMASKGSKKVGNERVEMKIRTNREILGMLNAGVTTHAIFKKFKISYSGAKNPS